MNPQSVDPKDNKPADPIYVLVIIAMCMLFIIMLIRTLNPSPVDVVADKKQAVEEVNTINNRTAYEVARGGVNIILYKAEVNNTVIYFTNQGGVWGHSK